MARRPSRLAAQSAMEYLMTYGWAILIIAVVLAALFELGVFNGSNLAPQACIAQAGFVCRNPIYTANGIGITFGQTTGRDYYGDWVFVAAQGEALNQNGIPMNFTCANVGCANAVSVGVLVPGQIVGVDFNASKFAYGQIPANAPIGTPFAGYVWLGYCFGPCSAPTAYSKVATINVKESGTSSTAFGGYFGGGSGSSAPQPAQQFSFTVSVSPTSNTITAGQSTNAVVTITTPIFNNANVVTLSDTAPPISKTFNPLSCTPDPTCTSTLSISTTPSAQPGSYPITVTGTNALTGATNSTAYTLTVTSPYVQITLNPGSTISGTFQQNITFNPSTYSAYESSDLGNIRFCTDPTCSSGYLDSWLEGCPETACTQSSSQAIFWVKLPNGETSGENIYMVFGPTSGTGSEFDGSIAGEAPQISQTYAQYDNGANVFALYTDFSGTSLSSGFSSASESGVTVSVNNGLTMSGGRGGEGDGMVYTSSTYPNYIIDTGINSISAPTSNDQPGIIDAIGSISSGCPDSDYSCTGYRFGYNYWNTQQLQIAWASSGGTQGGVPCGASIGTQSSGVLTGMWRSTGSETAYFNYANMVSCSDSTDGLGSANQYAIIYASTSTSTTSSYWWLRLRAIPPSGVMPSYGFGSVQ